MTTKSFSAWLIHKEWSGDTSARIFLLSAEHGLISCLYRGGRLPKKQALLQPFVHLWVSVVERHERYYIHSLEHNGPALPLLGTSLFSALYLNEILYYTLKFCASEPTLFQAYNDTLHHLKTAQNKELIEVLLRRFEWTLLHACGHHFPLTHEADNGEPVNEHYFYRFIPGRGMICAASGIPGTHLLALATEDWSSSDYLKSAKYIMRCAIDYLLEGKIIKARSLFISSV